MARLARVNDEDDYFGKVINGIQTGMGIAQAINQKKLTDAQMERHKYEFDELKANRETRDLQSEADKSTAKTTRLGEDAKFRMALGAASGDFEQTYLGKTSDSPDIAAKNYGGFISEMSGGRFALSQGVPTNVEGKRVFTSTFSEGGKPIQQIQYTDNADLRKQIAAIRMQGGFLDVDTYNLIDTGRKLRAAYQQVNPNGDFEADTKSNPGLLKKLYNMVGANETATQYDEGREKHKWGGEQHNSQMVTEGLRQDSIRQSMSHANAARGEAAEEHRQRRENYEYNVNVTRKYEEMLRDDTLRNNAANFYPILSEALEARFTELQPTYASSVDPLDPMAGLGATGQPKKQYSDKSLAMKEYAIKVHDSLPKDMPLDQKFEAIEIKLNEAKLNEAKKPVVDPTPEQSASEESQQRRSRPADRPTERQAGTPVPQPLGLGVGAPTANDMAAETKRTEGERGVIDKGLQILSHGYKSPEQLKYEEEIRSRMLRQQ